MAVFLKHQASHPRHRSHGFVAELVFIGLNLLYAVGKAYIGGGYIGHKGVVEKKMGKRFPPTDYGPPGVVVGPHHA